MEYKIEQIGKAMNDKAVQSLESQMTANGQAGWRFHSVFSVVKTGCLGNPVGTTYLAVYVKGDNLVSGGLEFTGTSGEEPTKIALPIGTDHYGES